MTYDEAVAWLTGLGRFGVKLGLDRTRALLAELGHPEAGKRGALVAGTNGKGSTCAFLASILEAGGHRTGTMPSPHLRSYAERIQVGGTPIAEPEFAAAVAAVQPAAERVAAREGPPTEFELLTAVALNWLAERCDRLVIEVGMGGRLDATNVLDLGVAAVTNVSLDHTRWLGSTVEEIAAEKAAIIKPGNLALTAAQEPALGVIRSRAAAAGARLWTLGEEVTVEARSRGWEGSVADIRGPGFDHLGLEIPLVGSFQPRNAALAVAAAEALGDATPAAVREGLARTRWPGRLQVVPGPPRVVLDGAHNPAGVAELIASVGPLLEAPPVVVFAAMRDKDLGAMLTELRRLQPRAVIFTRATSGALRSADPSDLRELWGEAARVVEPPAAALEAAREAAGPEGTVVVCGTLYMLGELGP